MHFSEKEKEIIKHIDTGKIHDLLSYLEVMVQLKEVPNIWGNLVFNGSMINANEPVKIIEDENALARELNSFLALCYKLEKFYLLQTLENSTFKTPPTLLLLEASGPVFSFKIYDIFGNNRQFTIVPFNELTQFIENGFLTADEINLKEERKARIMAQRTSVVIAVVLSFITTLTSAGIAYFNYKTYTTERKVSITNLDAIKSPISVSISELPKQIEVITKAAPKDSRSKKPEISR